LSTQRTAALSNAYARDAAAGMPLALLLYVAAGCAHFIASSLSTSQHLFCPMLMFRYFLRKLRRVKKANGQIIAVNEVRQQQQMQ
jgi:hypothetical protein